jgi:hypothetical protein
MMSSSKTLFVRFMNLVFNIEDQGHPADCVGVNIKKLEDGSYEFTQFALIDAVIADVTLKDPKTKPVPAKASLHLHAIKDEPAFNLNFNYWSVVSESSTIWLKPLVQTSCTLPIRLPSTHPIQGRHMVMRFSI